MAPVSGFKFPLDAYVLAIPVTYACAALAGLVYKTLRFDPEQSTAKFYDDERAASEMGEKYRHMVSDRFQHRIRGHESWSVPLWSNEPGGVSHPHS